ncbi:MAG: DUF2232 domain-containing protein [Peptococcaceae bacterium]|nr:DUF2232 domain-containing protein [Peptococcaceae bacterium]
MYISDRNALQYASRMILVLVPFFSSWFNTWSWIVEILLLFAIFIHCRGSGVRLTAMLLAIGYLAAFIPAGGEILARIGFTPWAGIVFLGLKNRGMSTSHSMFWGLALVALFSALPAAPVVQVALQPKALEVAIREVLDFYQQQGFLSSLEKQGMSPAEFEGVLRLAVPIYYKLLPAIAGIIGMLEFGIAYWTYSYSLKRVQRNTPFYLWQLPWYAVWVAIIGLAAYLGGGYLGKSIIEIAGLNIMAMTAPVSMIMGFSCVSYFLKHPKMPRVFAIALIFAVAFFPFIVLAGLVMTGLFDLVFNFRKIPEKIEGGEQ